MNSEEKILALRDRIYKTICPLIGRKCVLLGLPYYKNVGDLLIWEGTKQMLTDNNIECLYCASKTIYRNIHIDHDVTILLQGGGNFGDLWRSEQEYRNEIVSKFPNNRIIILPQSVYYHDSDLLNRDAVLFSQHKDLYICARDTNSLAILKEHFSKNELLLVPDMAFSINIGKYDRLGKKRGDKGLLLRRNDKESIPIHKYIPSNIPLEEHDWPSLEGSYISFKASFFLILYKNRNLIGHLADYFADILLKDVYIRNGVRFLKKYSVVYSTRLHGGILSIFLGKKVYMIDNSYGKNRSFYETWLQDLDTIEIIGDE